MKIHKCRILLAATISSQINYLESNATRCQMILVVFACRQSLSIVLSQISIEIMNSFSRRFDRHREPHKSDMLEIRLELSILSRRRFFLSLISTLHPRCALSSEMVIDREFHKNSLVFSYCFAFGTFDTAIYVQQGLTYEENVRPLSTII